MNLPNPLLIDLAKNVANNFISFNQENDDDNIDDFFSALIASKSIDKIFIDKYHNYFEVKPLFENILSRLTALKMIKNTLIDTKCTLINKLTLEDLYVSQSHSLTLKKLTESSIDEDIIGYVKFLEMLDWQINENTGTLRINYCLIEWLVEFYQVDESELYELIHARFNLNDVEVKQISGDIFYLLLAFAFETLEGIGISCSLSQYLETVLHVDGYLIDDLNDLPDIDTFLKIKSQCYVAIKADFSNKSKEELEKYGFYDPTPCLLKFVAEIDELTKFSLINENGFLNNVNNCNSDRNVDFEDNLFNVLVDDVVKPFFRKIKNPFYENF